MLSSLLPLALMMHPSLRAPIILSEEDAREIDRLIDYKDCRIDKQRHSRWYWFDFKAPGDGKHVIDSSMVRFAIIDDGKGRVVATAFPNFPLHYRKMVGGGTYRLASDQTEIWC